MKKRSASLNNINLSALASPDFPQEFTEDRCANGRTRSATAHNPELSMLAHRKALQSALPKAFGD